MAHGALWTTVLYRGHFTDTKLNRSEDIVTKNMMSIATIGEILPTNDILPATTETTEREITGIIGKKEGLVNARDATTDQQKLERSTQIFFHHLKKVSKARLA